MKPLQFEQIDKARKDLGLGISATITEIKKAYHSLAKKWHPDRCKDSEHSLCNEKMKTINHAYKTLLDYVSGYRYSFGREELQKDSPEERWKKQFWDDPVWGSGSSWKTAKKKRSP